MPGFCTLLITVHTYVPAYVRAYTEKVTRSFEYTTIVFHFIHDVQYVGCTSFAHITHVH